MLEFLHTHESPTCQTGLIALKEEGKGYFYNFFTVNKRVDIFTQSNVYNFLLILVQLTDSSRVNIPPREKISDVTPAIHIEDYVLDIEIYRRLIINYLLTMWRGFNITTNNPLLYIKSGMLSARKIHHENMSKCGRFALDMSWVNIYRDEINKEVNLMLDPSSSLLANYNFIPDYNQTSINRIEVITDFIIYSDRRCGGICYKCTFQHPRYHFEYDKFKIIYPFVNPATYNYIINNCFK